MEEASIHGGLPGLVIGIDVNGARTTYQHQSVASRFLIRGFYRGCSSRNGIMRCHHAADPIITFKSGQSHPSIPVLQMRGGDLRNKMLLGNFALLGGVE